MNEYSNFKYPEIPETGSCDNNAENINDNTNNNNNEDPFSDLPFIPTGDDHPLNEKTISIDAYHYNEPDALYIYRPNKTVWEYDFHNLLGFSESIATYNAMDTMGYKLKFILTRSSMFGSGHYTS